MGYTTHRLSTKSILYYIDPTQIKMHTHIIILREFKPHPQVKIEFFLGEYILKALMVSENIYVNTIQVVSPNL